MSRRAWFVDFASALIMGVLVTAIVLLSGGPPWAAAGFGIVVYLTRPTREQERDRTYTIKQTRKVPA